MLKSKVTSKNITMSWNSKILMNSMKEHVLYYEGWIINLVAVIDGSYKSDKSIVSVSFEDCGIYKQPIGNSEKPTCIWWATCPLLFSRKMAIRYGPHADYHCIDQTLSCTSSITVPSQNESMPSYHHIRHYRLHQTVVWAESGGSNGLGHGWSQSQSSWQWVKPFSIHFSKRLKRQWLPTQVEKNTGSHQ